MPIQIPAGQSFTFDVVVHTSGIGEDEFAFDMFIDHNKTLFIEKIKENIIVLDSGRTEPDWIQKVAQPEASEQNQPEASEQNQPEGSEQKEKEQNGE